MMSRGFEGFCSLLLVFSSCTPFGEGDQLYPDNAPLDFDAQSLTVDTWRSSQVKKVVNMEQKAFEAMELRTVIDEDRVPDYLGDKEGLQARDWDRMQKAREGWEQESLRKWE